MGGEGIERNKGVERGENERVAKRGETERVVELWEKVRRKERSGKRKKDTDRWRE